jgi:UDP-N-acetylmuramate dehydrogenase
VKEVAADELELGYDRSRLQRTGEAVMWAEFRVGEDSISSLRAKARSSLAYRKRTQPLAVPSAGCVFRNPDGEDKESRSAGQLIDSAGLKGESVGGATVSSLHGNFIVTDGRATSKDIRELIDACKDTVSRRLGILLREEIVCLGEFVTDTSSVE